MGVINVLIDILQPGSLARCVLSFSLFVDHRMTIAPEFGVGSCNKRTATKDPTRFYVALPLPSFSFSLTKSRHCN